MTKMKKILGIYSSLLLVESNNLNNSTNGVAVAGTTTTSNVKTVAAKSHLYLHKVNFQE